MKPDGRFLGLPKNFWAYIRTISEIAGYTVRGSGTVKIPTLTEIEAAIHSVGLDFASIVDGQGQLTELGRSIVAYFEYRSDMLNSYVEPRLMDAERAKGVYESLAARLSPKCPLPMNKQKNEKKAPAYLTGIVNMLIESNANGFSCNYDPHELVTVTRDKLLLRTLARRVDGAFPSAVNPMAVWEIKEYYYTTTFGSRVADGVYESLVDGMELEELLINEGIKIQHLLIVDAHYTWWDCGRSYLCRILDMLHMGYVDEVLFGYEVVEQLPGIVKCWVAQLRSCPKTT